MLTELHTSTRRITFDVVKTDRAKRYTCADCGQDKSRKMTFEQTENPFTVNEDGEQKTRKKIYAELNEQADAWQPDPHCGCTIDERPEKRLPSIPMTKESLDLSELMDKAQVHLDALKCIEQELKQRLEGARIKVKTDNDRMGYVRHLYLETYGTRPSVCISPWLEQRKNPKRQFGDSYSSLGLSDVEFVLE